MASIPHLRADIETIKSIYKSDPVARTIFDDLGRRQRSTPETSVDRLLAILENKGHTASKTDVIQFLQALEKAGCGSFILGRRGHPSRFKWSDNFIDLGRAAAGHAINEEAITE